MGKGEERVRDRSTGDKPARDRSRNRIRWNRPAGGRAEAPGVLIQVCEICGKEYLYDDEPPPAQQQCAKCGNRVFRSFYEEPVGDDAAADFRDSTSRDVATDDGGSDVSASDIADLNNP